MNITCSFLNKVIQNPINNVTVFVRQYLAYKSSISLENLYPNSSLKITTPQKPPNDGDRFSGYIPMSKIQIITSKSSGPGGQNVNKVNTKVDLRFHLESADWLDEEIKKKLAVNLKSRITNEGFLIFRSDVTRSQQLNIADCLQKLRNAIRDAMHEEPVQSPETAERLRKRHEKNAVERLMVKRHRSQVKQDRTGASIYDVM